MKAMILAAGLGTRLRPYSLLRPKPLFPVLDRPLLLHTIDRLRRAGAEQIVVNAHHLREQIVQCLQELPAISIQLEDTILGTGGGLRQALPVLGQEPVLVVNGDIFHDFDLRAIYQAHVRAGVQATLVMHDYPRFNCVAVTKDGMVAGFTPEDDRSVNAGRQLAFTGVHVAEPALLATIEVGVFSSIIDCYADCLRRGGAIQALVVEKHYWTDMGTPADYLDLHARLLKTSTGQPLSADLGQDPSPFYVGQDVQLGAGTEFLDWVAVGSRARIGVGARLERVVVWDGAIVEPGRIIKDAIIC
jgi:mannose-1-phosphate guanylyltransferase